MKEINEGVNFWTQHTVENVSDQINNDEKTRKDLFDYLLDCIPFQTFKNRRMLMHPFFLRYTPICNSNH